MSDWWMWALPTLLAFGFIGALAGCMVYKMAAENRQARLLAHRALLEGACEDSEGDLDE